MLRFLYTNAGLEQEQCEEGFCFASEDKLSDCKDTDWGTYPCMSTVYDWRDGTLADVADWPSLFVQVCNTAALTYTKTVLLQTSAECTATTLSSRHVRSLYQASRPACLPLPACLPPPASLPPPCLPAADCLPSAVSHHAHRVSPLIAVWHASVSPGILAVQ